jgi:hypothetical protein
MPIDARQWLNEMSLTYATAEQRRNHTGQEAGGPAPEITFF